MTDWIVGNAWWVAPALTFAGAGMLMGALLWPRKVTNAHQPQRLSQMIADAPVQHFGD